MTFFFIWSHRQEKLVGFLDNCNKFHPNDCSKKYYIFRPWCKNVYHKIVTALHIKPTDTHQFLHYSSLNSYRAELSIVYSQALLVSRICLCKNDFFRHRNEMKSCFLNRGYPKTLIDMEVSKVKFRNTSGVKRTKTNGIPLVITYHPLLKDFAKVINRQLHLLYLNDKVIWWGQKSIS